MPELLPDEEIEAQLEGLERWRRSGDALTKSFNFETFRDTIVFVNRVATLADENEHHPDIDIRYTEVSLSLSTHSEGGITEKDIDLARQIDFATSAR